MPSPMAAPADGFELPGIIAFWRRSAENVVDLLGRRSAVHTPAL